MRAGARRGAPVAESLECSRALEIIDSLGDGKAARTETRFLKTHVKQCPECRAHYRRMKTVLSALEAIERVTAPDGFARMVMERIAVGMADSAGAVEPPEGRRRGLVVFVGAAGAAAAVAVGLTVWRKVAGHRGGDERIPAVGAV